jgi:ABC-2 type transport system permease protein
MRNIHIIAGRELAAYFATPVATVFIVIFLVLQGTLTFNLGNFFDRGQADLNPFFSFLPWVFLLLVPAITMRLWAEERRLGTIELLLTLPITQGQAVIAKFLAAWAFCAIALVLTFPIILTVRYLGDPDMGVIWSGYFGALLIAGAFLSIGSATSALTRNQVIAFVLGVAVCFIFAAASYPLVVDFLSRDAPVLAEIARRFAVIDRYQDFTRGIVSLGDLVFFTTFIAFWLFVTTVLVDQRKAD